MSASGGMTATPAEALQSAGYSCPCGASPVQVNGHVKVIHKAKCPRRPWQRLMARKGTAS